jgi:cytochrome b561
MQSAGKPIPYFGDFYPSMILESTDFKKTFINIHEYLGNMIYVFIGAHAIMAIWRKYIMKEGAMQKILLSKASRSH